MNLAQIVPDRAGFDVRTFISWPSQPTPWNRTRSAGERVNRSRQSRDAAGNPPQPDRDLDAEADAALEAARSMAPGSDKAEALKKAGLMRKAADARGIAFAKRGRPPKQ